MCGGFDVGRLEDGDVIAALESLFSLFLRLEVAELGKNCLIVAKNETLWNNRGTLRNVTSKFQSRINTYDHNQRDVPHQEDSACSVILKNQRHTLMFKPGRLS